MAKKISNNIVLLVLIAFGFFSCKNSSSEKSKENSEYYYNVSFRESPYKEFAGVHKVSREEAQKRNHYRFTYNDQEKLIELAFMRGQKLAVNNLSSNFYMMVSKITFSYQENKEILKYYNFKNERIAFNKVWKAVYEYDQKGNRINLRYYDKENQLVEKSDNIARYEWMIDKQSRVKEQRFNLKNEQVRIRPDFDFYEVRMTFDDKGYIMKLENYGKEGVLTNNNTGVAMDKIKYDEHGQFIQWKVFDKEEKSTIGNMPGSAGGNHHYNEYGDDIKLELFDLEENLMIGDWGFAYMLCKYDSYGNRILQSDFDNQNNPISVNKNDIYATGFQFNELNQRLSLSFYDKEGQLGIEKMQGIAKATYSYDTNGDLTERKYLDKEENLVNNKMRGYTVEKYVKNSDGKIDTLRYDANMKLVKNK